MEVAAASNPAGGGGEAVPDLKEDTSIEAFADLLGGQESGQPDDPEPVGDETDEAVPDDAEGEQPDEEGDEQAAEDEPQYEVTVDGAKLKVGLDELKRGYQRLSDYTRKTQRLAQDRETVEGHLRQRHETMLAAEEQLLAALNRYVGQEEPEPDWEQVAAEVGPLEAQQRFFAWQSRQRGTQQARAELERIQDQQKQRDEQAHGERLTTERQALAAKWTGAKDQNELSRQVNETLAEVGKAYGFSKEELESIPDHRLVLMARDAAAYRKLKAAKPAALNRQPPLRGGAIAPPGADTRRRLAAADEQLTRTRSVDAFADLLTQAQLASRAGTR